jgi:hypothetical protein
LSSAEALKWIDHASLDGVPVTGLGLGVVAGEVEILAARNLQVVPDGLAVRVPELVPGDLIEVPAVLAQDGYLLRAAEKLSRRNEAQV